MGDTRIRIDEQKLGWAAFVNTDLTEGRGQSYPIAVCSLKATALRLGYKKNVQGCNADIREISFFRIGDTWYGPIKLEHPTEEDKKNENKATRHQEAVKKAKAAGLTDEDIAIIMIGENGE